MLNKLINTVISGSTVTSNSSITTDLIGLSSGVEIGLSLQYTPDSQPTSTDYITVQAYTSPDGNINNLDTFPYIEFTNTMSATSSAQQFTYTFDCSGISFIQFKIINNSGVNLNVTQSSIIAQIF